MITIRRPLFFSEIGRKPTQEDCLFPASPDIRDHLFILCDGMGGHNKGDVASSTVARTLGKSLSEYLRNRQAITPQRFNSALTEAYDALEKIPEAASEPRPGTTLAAIAINSRSILAAHIGDSRIYHIRPSLFDSAKGQSGILYRSEDHSIVGELVRAGQITDDEARTHPRRNIITRAIQPRLQNRFEPTFRKITDLRSGDYLFLCTDGIIEQLSDSALAGILADTTLSDTEKIDAIKKICDNRTRDNYTACLIPISAVEIPARKKRVSLRQLIILAFLTALAVMASLGIASRYFCQNKPDESGNPLRTDSAATPADTAAIDTIRLQTPIETTDTTPDPQPGQPATPAVADPVPMQSDTHADTAANRPTEALQEPNQPAKTTETVEKPDSVRTQPPSVVPPKPDRTKPATVPPRKKEKTTRPQPLA